MGCGGSTNGEGPSPDGEGRGGAIFRRQPKVSVKIGPEAKILERHPRVIIVFGGPGTKKGRLLDNLKYVFGFEIVNVENVILDELAKKLEEPQPNRTVPAIQAMLKNEQEMLRLDTVLKMICRKIDTIDKDKFIIVDLLPNLKWMLNNPTFIRECSNEIRFFEEKYPISFVMHFVVPKEKVLNKLEMEAKKTLATGEKPQPKPEKPDPAATTKPGDKAGGGGAKQSDEADSSRTQKRVLLFENSIKHFMEYFNKKEKVVTVDVSCGIPDIIWSRVCGFFTDFDFHSAKTPETVIVFGFDQSELDEINIGQYSLTVISLRDLAFDPKSSVEVLLELACKYVDTCDPTRRVFAIDGTGTSLTRDLSKKKTKKGILFNEKGETCRLGRYANVNLTTKGDPIELQAMSSSENEVCLFSTKISPDLCRWIAQVMIDCRDKNAAKR